MFFKQKFVFILIVLVLCVLSLNEIYGKPISNTEEEVEAAPFIQMIKNKHHGCPNRMSGCDNGYCWSKCGSDTLHKGHGYKYTSYSNSWHRAYTGCKSDKECHS